MALEDRKRREPQPFRPGPGGPLDVLAALGPLPAPPGRAGTWSPPAPAPYQPDRLRVHLSPAPAPARGTAIVVPPWKVPSRRLLRPWMRLVSRARLDAWLLVPPYHLERTPAGGRSGEDFVSPDLGRLRAALAQAVLELRLCAAVAAGRGPVTVLGLSLGALVAAWAATGPEPIDGAALVAVPADLPSVFRSTAIGARYARLAAAAGAPLPPPAELEARLVPLAPLGRKPTARRVLLAAGTEDRIALGGPTALAAAWGVPVQAYPRGHLTLIFACAAVRRDVEAFLAGAAAPGAG